MPNTTSDSTLFPAIISLVTFNGINGFKMDGEAPHDISGMSVNIAGDINGDNYLDLLIGAPSELSGNNGRCYVVFGGTEVISSGSLPLNSLDGTNGFKVDDAIWRNVHTLSAADINGDSYADLLVGTVGRSFVMFGSPRVGSSGLFQLDNLNGTNGFELDAEVADDESGYSFNAAGDVNGDGYVDLLIGAPHYGSNTGRSYVVLGSSHLGSSEILMLSSLNGTNGFKLDGEAANSDSGCTVSTAGDINGDGYAIY